MANLLDLSPDEFMFTLQEFGYSPERRDELIRQYREHNSVFGALNRAAQERQAEIAGEGRRPVAGGFLSKPEGSLGMDAVRGLRVEPMAGLLGMLTGAGRAVEAPAAAYQGLIPMADVPLEALGTAGITSVGGAAMTRPAGSVGVGGRVYHGGPETITRENLKVMPDSDGLPIGFSVTRDANIAEMYKNMRGGGAVSEFDMDFDGANIISEMDFYDFIDDLEMRLGVDEGELTDAQVQAALLSAKIDAIEYPDPEFGIRVINPNILAANRDQTVGLLSAAASGESRAQTVARLLREGRQSEVTDDLLATLTPNDNAELFRLYDEGATGMDLPMDEASRMARAREAGLVDNQYHATFDDFAAFIPSETGLTGRGVYTGDSAPDVLDYARSRRSSTDGLNVIPVLTPSGSSYARNIDYQNTLDADPDLPYNATWEQNIEGMRRAADTMSAQGFPGVHSQPGERVTFNPSSIRSPFARFDPRLSDNANLLAANRDQTVGLLSTAAAAEPRNAAERMARDILDMRAAGRAGEVTDAMMAQADPQYMFANTPLPMDEASRMARAGEMFPDIAFHATGRDFDQFIPSEFRGASFFATTPDGASRGAAASANEGVGSGSNMVLPVRVNTSKVEGLGAYGQRDMNDFRASLPNRVFGEPEMDVLMASDAAPRYSNWTHFFDDLTDYDALRQFREKNPEDPIPDGIIGYQPRQPLRYASGLRSDISGRQFAHYSEGMSERPISDYAKSIGNTGFTMMDESGLALAVTDPSTIRSRFARFDPEFAHLANLNAANIDPLAGLFGALAAEEQRRQRNSQ